MAEIGVTLREARMRAGIDIAEVESRTKIRAKYLRALENEEWSLLPGTTFVKSFLRTYAEMLGLDAKLLVEEYKFRHEPYEVGANTGAARGRRGGGRRGSAGAFGPPKRTNLLPILVLVLVVAAAIFAVVKLSKGEDQPPPAALTTTSAAPQTASQADAAAAKEKRRRKRIVRLRITAPSNEGASVCVVDASGRRVVNGKNLNAGQRTAVLRSSRFKIAVSGGATVRDGTTRLRLRSRKNVIAYQITKGRQKILADSQKPSC